MSMGLEEWDLPSDAMMINWLEARCYRVCCGNGYWWVEGFEIVDGRFPAEAVIKGRGPTWRAAVEAAMGVGGRS